MIRRPIFWAASLSLLFSANTLVAQDLRPIETLPSPSQNSTTGQSNGIDEQTAAAMERQFKLIEARIKQAERELDTALQRANAIREVALPRNDEPRLKEAQAIEQQAIQRYESVVRQLEQISAAQNAAASQQQSGGTRPPAYSRHTVDSVPRGAQPTPRSTPQLVPTVPRANSGTRSLTRMAPPSRTPANTNRSTLPAPRYASPNSSQTRTNPPRANQPRVNQPRSSVNNQHAGVRGSAQPRSGTSVYRTPNNRPATGRYPTSQGQAVRTNQDPRYRQVDPRYQSDPRYRQAPPAGRSPYGYANSRSNPPRPQQPPQNQSGSGFRFWPFSR